MGAHATEGEHGVGACHLSLNHTGASHDLEHLMTHCISSFVTCIFYFLCIFIY